MSNEPTRPLATVLSRYLAKAGLEGVLLHGAAWEAAVGELLARHVRPVDRVHGALILEADAEQWRAQVCAMEAQLLPRLAAQGLEVTRLTVRLAPGAEPRRRR